MKSEANCQQRNTEETICNVQLLKQPRRAEERERV